MWQDISTAPKDGTIILACGMTQPIWQPPRGEPRKPEPFMETIHWAGGFWQAGWVGTIPAPTHWMPLPPPPTTKADSDGDDGA